MIESKIIVDSKPVAYIPALGLKSLTPFFDPFLRWSGREKKFKNRLVELSRIQRGAKILDLGCGTGTLAILIKKEYPEANVTGLDIDPEVLKIAEKKSAAEGVRINFDIGSAFMLPYPDRSFDLVVSSLMFHHLTRENKIRALKEAFRILKENGELHIADLGKPQNFLMRIPSALMGHLEEAADNVRGMLFDMIKLAGFSEAEENDTIMTMYGTVSIYSGRRNCIGV